jgi:hypothetical protein
MLMKRGSALRRTMAKTTLNPFATTQVKVMRRRVMQQDLDMYAAISGRAPTVQEDAEPAEQAVRVVTAAKARPWSASVLAGYLNGMRVPRLAEKVVSPEVTEWMRKLSNQALGRLQEAQDRLAAARQPIRLREVQRDGESKAA